MKKIMVYLAVMGLLVVVGCAPTNISRVQNKLGPPGDVVKKGDLTTYFYYTYYGEGFCPYGWWCQQFTCNKDGNITKKREYWIGDNQKF
jgi:hypothetical protein